MIANFTFEEAQMQVGDRIITITLHNNNIVDWYGHRLLTGYLSIKKNTFKRNYTIQTYNKHFNVKVSHRL